MFCFRFTHKILRTNILGPAYNESKDAKQTICCNRTFKGPFTPSVSVNGFATHFQASPLISMRTELLASSQSCHSIDADAWCKRAINTLVGYVDAKKYARFNRTRYKRTQCTMK